MTKIDPTKYGTPAEVAEVVGMSRTTLTSAVKREDDRLEVVKTVGGTQLVSVKSAKRYHKKPPKPGRKAQ